MASVKSAVRQLIKQDYGNICQLCFQKFPDNKLQIHHRRPRQFGGTNHYTNLLPLCGGNGTQDCHMKVHRYNIQFNRKGRRILILDQPTQIKITIKLVR